MRSSHRSHSNVRSCFVAGTFWSAPAWPSASACGPSVGMAGVHSPQRARTMPARPSLVRRSIPHRARPLACSHARALTPHDPASCPCSVSCFADLCGSLQSACTSRSSHLRAAAVAACAPRPGLSAPSAWRRGYERGASGVGAAAPTAVHRCTLHLGGLGGLERGRQRPYRRYLESAGLQRLGSTLGPGHAVGVRGMCIEARGGRSGSA